MTRVTGSDIRVLIVDDHPVVRDGLRAMFLQSNIEVIGEAVDGLDAVEKARLLKPDVILMDVRMPDMDGLAATRIIKEENSSIAVVMMTSFESKDYLRDAVKAGAAAYLLKGVDRTTILRAIENVVDGASLFAPSELVSLLREVSPTNPMRVVIDSLSNREIAVLNQISQGKTNSEIAEILDFSVGTIKKSVHAIIVKLNASDRTQAAVTAVRSGWVPDPVEDDMP